MTPEFIIDQMASIGVAITVDGDDLNCIYSGDVPEDVFGFLREHKIMLVKYLRYCTATVECRMGRAAPYDINQLFGETDFVEWWRSLAEFPEDGSTLIVKNRNLADQACALLREILPTYRSIVSMDGSQYAVTLQLTKP